MTKRKDLKETTKKDMAYLENVCKNAEALRYTFENLLKARTCGLGCYVDDHVMDMIRDLQNNITAVHEQINDYIKNAEPIEDDEA